MFWLELFAFSVAIGFVSTLIFYNLAKLVRNSRNPNSQTGPGAWRW